ncbi:ricin-type beta-trefoil lectin domain protein [Streptomyces sp. NPDC093252]|uniref:ricin-type beta-trefoil lectin domain protein n=1 Tax=Streptomyces sp. NPDC093252 TaxID=3154980 RepID=UPI00343C7739
MLDAGSSNSPDPVPHPVGELLDRHWEAAFAYARLCTDGSRAAGMLTTAAFTRLFGQSPAHGAPSPLWRQRLLTAVRRIAAEWSADDRHALLAPELRAQLTAPPRGESRARGLRRAPSDALVPSGERRLVAAAFRRLPESARCLLWHIEVESDPPAVPAALLDSDPVSAETDLRRARERLRAECVQVHHELAPSQRCRHFSRMLDVTCRRGGAGIDPDLGTHVDACPHCRHTADQLRRFDTDLGVVLAEAVLGWGARPYVATRAAREAPAGIPPRPTHAPFTAVPPQPDAPAPGARPPAPRVAARRAAARRRNRAAVLLTAGALVAVPLGLWAANGSGEGAPATAGTPGTGRAAPPSGPGDPSGFDPASAPERDVRGRLHNVASGLCLSVAGGEVAKGAGTELAPCGDDPAQRWSYETDGLLRSAADPGLCVDSRIGHSVRLTACGDTADVRYDLTRDGTLVPRWDQDLALTPAATDGTGALMVKLRDGGQAQHWVFDTSGPDLRMAAVDWDDIGGLGRTTPPPPAPTTAKPAPAPSPTTAPRPPATPSAAPTPTPEPSTDHPCYPYAYCDGDDGDGGRGDGDGGGGEGGHGGGGGRGGR